MSKHKIHFYEQNGDFGFLSNFYGTTNNKRFKLVIDDVEWPSVEHYFQAQKFLGGLDISEETKNYANSIRQSKTPNIAKILAQQKIGGGYAWRTNLNPIIQQSLDAGVKIRIDWESVKDSIMKKAIVAKFTQNPDLMTKLMSTGSDELIEHTSRDNYWADGGDGSGLNKLGRILMSVRDDFRPF